MPEETGTAPSPAIVTLELVIEVLGEYYDFKFGRRITNSTLVKQIIKRDTLEMVVRTIITRATGDEADREAVAKACNHGWHAMTVSRVIRIAQKYIEDYCYGQSG